MISSRDRTSSVPPGDQPSSARKLNMASGRKPFSAYSTTETAPCRLESLVLVLAQNQRQVRVDWRREAQRGLQSACESGVLGRCSAARMTWLICIIVVVHHHAHVVGGEAGGLPDHRVAHQRVLVGHVALNEVMDNGRPGLGGGEADARGPSREAALLLLRRGQRPAAPVVARRQPLRPHHLAPLVQLLGRAVAFIRPPRLQQLVEVRAVDLHPLGLDVRPIRPAPCPAPRPSLSPSSAAPHR